MAFILSCEERAHFSFFNTNIAHLTFAFVNTSSKPLTPSTVAVKVFIFNRSHSAIAGLQYLLCILQVLLPNIFQRNIREINVQVKRLINIVV